jgi:hypothetical protein
MRELRFDRDLPWTVYRPHALQTACSQQNAVFCADPKKSCR